MEAGLLEKGLKAGAELVNGKGTDMLGVEPDSFRIEGVVFLEVDHRVGAVDTLESESGGELVKCEELAVVFGRPAEEAEEVDESVGEEAGIAISGDADDGAMAALGELGAVGCDQQGQMCELGRWYAEGLEDQQVLESVGEVVLSANDVADAEVGVVCAGGQVIGGHAVKPPHRRRPVGGGPG